MPSNLSKHTENTIKKIMSYGMSRTEAICLLDDAATNGGIEYEAMDCEENAITLRIDVDGNLTVVA
jgi:hypothetical protein